MHAWKFECVCFSVYARVNLLVFCGWVSSNKHCTLFYSDPTRRQKQQAQPHLIICNGNSHHYHNILFRQTFRFPGGRPIRDQNDLRSTHKHCQSQWEAYGWCLVAEKRLCKHIHHSTHDWAHVATTRFPLLPLSIQHILIQNEDFHGLHRGIFNVVDQGWRGKRKAGKQCVLICMHYMLAFCHVFVSVASRVWVHVGVSSTSRGKCCSLKNYIISHLKKN